MVGYYRNMRGPFEGYMTIAEAAKRFGYSTRTLRYAAMRGTLPAQLVGNIYMVHEDDMRAHVERTGHERGRPRKPKPEEPTQ